MEAVLTGLAWVLVALTAAGTLELFLLTFGWLAGKPLLRRAPVSGAQPATLGVVIPAHDEAHGIADTVRGVLAAKQARGVECNVLVVADNCTDDTAERARAAGATVLERSDEQLRGKGYALDFAFGHLLEQGVDALIVLDADARVPEDFFERATGAFARGAEALQFGYTIGNPESSPRARLQHVALLAFNVLRPLSRERLGFSVGIFGNGFGLTADLLRRVPYTADSIVEDLEYHLELVRAGARVRFVEGPPVVADAPPPGAGAETQRAHWEGGRFRMIAEHAPKLLGQVLTGKLRMLEPLLELLLLPLAFHLLLLSTLPLLGGWQALYGLGALALVAVHVVLGIAVGGGGPKEYAALCRAPFYVLWKLRLLPKLLKTASRKAGWERTQRAAEVEAESKASSNGDRAA